MTMTLTTIFKAILFLAAGAGVLVVLWNVFSAIVQAIKYRLHPETLPPKPIYMTTDPYYHPTRWGVTLPDDPKEANERLKWAARMIFAGLETLNIHCEFTPEEARSLEMMPDHLELIQRFNNIYQNEIDTPEESTKNG